jgi:histidinol-phosphate aminotransferase
MESIPEYVSGVGLIKKFANLVITRTFSKVYGLAGLRIGYAVAAPEIIKIIASRKQSGNVNIVAQHAAITAYLDSEYRQNVIAEVNKNRILLENALLQMGIAFISTHTNFIMVKVKQSSIEVYKKLLTYNIVIQPMEIYGLSEYIRVSIGNEEDTRKFISILPDLV